MTLGSTIKLTTRKGARYFITLTGFSIGSLHGDYARCERRSWSFKPEHCFEGGSFLWPEIAKIEICPDFSHNITKLAQNK
jgi:hypothetical protein